MTGDFFESYYRTYNNEDPNALSEFYHNDVVFRSGAAQRNGKEALLSTYRFIISKMKDTMTPRNIIISGNQAAIEIHDRVEAKQDIEDYLGQRLSAGDSFEFELCGIYKVTDGKIKEIIVYRM